ncbi:MAG: S8 family serine peptidase [Bacteroidales bacterium]|nr:S8 family serine peptidase [Bacteroidales bacterium]
MRIILFLLLGVFVFDAFSQNGYYFVFFKNKSNNAYSLSNPSYFLSQRAIQRRINYNILLDSTDLPVTPDYVQELKNLGLSVHFTSKWLNGAMVKVTDPNILASIQNLPFVKSVKYTKPLVTPTTKINKFEQPKNYIYGMASNQIYMLNGNYLHNKGKLGQGMLIAVLDAGFNGADTIPQFDSLRNQNRILATRDMIDGNFDSYVYETHPHGTMVLATMATIDNGNYVGTAPRAQYILIRTEDGASEYVFEEYCWVAGAEFADSLGADVINSSLGYTTFDDTTMNHTWADLNGKTSVASIAATIAARKGMICCVSAGNWGNDLWRKIGIPADADSILTVGAVDAQKNYAFFSSQGYSADGRVKPDVCSQGLNAATASTAGVYTTASGTSFSSPILCGLVACLWQAFPQKNNMAIIDAIKRSANLYNSPDSLLGYGIPNFEISYHYLTNIEPNYFQDFNILSVYPSVTRQYVNIQFKSAVSNKLNVSIYSIDGKPVMKNEYCISATERDEIIFDVSLLSNGFYFLTVATKDNIFKYSFVKINE